MIAYSLGKIEKTEEIDVTEPEAQPMGIVAVAVFFVIALAVAANAGAVANAAAGANALAGANAAVAANAVSVVNTVYDGGGSSGGSR